MYYIKRRRIKLIWYNTLASADASGTIRLWEASTGKLKQRLVGTGHNEGIYSLKYSPDGTTLASAGSEIQLWDAKSGKHKLTFLGHYSLISSVAYSSDRNTVTSGGHDGLIRMWNTHTGKLRKTLITGPGTGSVLMFHLWCIPRMVQHSQVVVGV